MNPEEQKMAKVRNEGVVLHSAPASSSTSDSAVASKPPELDPQGNQGQQRHTSRFERWLLPAITAVASGLGVFIIGYFVSAPTVQVSVATVGFWGREKNVETSSGLRDSSKASAWTNGLRSTVDFGSLVETGNRLKDVGRKLEESKKLAEEWKAGLPQQNNGGQPSQLEKKTLESHPFVNSGSDSATMLSVLVGEVRRETKSLSEDAEKSLEDFILQHKTEVWPASSDAFSDASGNELGIIGQLLRRLAPKPAGEFVTRGRGIRIPSCGRDGKECKFFADALRYGSRDSLVYLTDWFIESAKVEIDELRKLVDYIESDLRAAVGITLLVEVVNTGGRPIVLRTDVEVVATVDESSGDGDGNSSAKIEVRYQGVGELDAACQEGDVGESGVGGILNILSDRVSGLDDADFFGGRMQMADGFPLRKIDKVAPSFVTVLAGDVKRIRVITKANEKDNQFRDYIFTGGKRSPLSVQVRFRDVDGNSFSSQAQSFSRTQ